MPHKRSPVALSPKALVQLNRNLYGLLRAKLWLQVLVGMILGISIGFLIGPEMGFLDEGTSSAVSNWLGLPANIFLGVIQMVVIPLVIASIISGISSSKSMKELKRTGLMIGAYFLATTCIAILLGVMLASWVQPGKFINREALAIDASAAENMEKTDGLSLNELPSAIGGLLPSNIFGSLLSGDMLKIVIFSIIIGVALVDLEPAKSKPIIDLLTSVQNVCMKIVRWAMLLAPLAVFGLMVKLGSDFGVDTLFGIGAYVVTVLFGLMLLLGFYMAIVFASSRIGPRDFLGRIRDVQLLAFSTSSSASVMPLTMKTAEDKLKVRPSVSQFIIPLGATINMDGTAIYQTIAAIFLAQIFGVYLGFWEILLIIVTIVGASIGTPSTPGVGIAILAIILQSAGIPVSGLALVLGVDRILDMSRTAVNVTGDLTACLFINRMIPGEKK